MFFAKDHIISHLRSLIKVPDQDFDIIFRNIKCNTKVEFRDLFIYVNKILNESLSQQADELNYIHLHFTGPIDHYIQPLLEFLSVKLFFFSFLQNDENQKTEAAFLNSQVSVINNLLAQPIKLSEGVTGRGDELKKAKKYRRELKQLKKFYLNLKKIQGCDKFHPRTLINVLSKDKKFLEEVFKGSRFGVTIENLSNPTDSLSKLSFVVLNSELNRDQIDEMIFENDINLIDEVVNVVIFDSESKSLHRQFNYSELFNLNNQEDTNFKNLIIFSFEKKPFKLSQLISTLDRISARYFRRPTGLKYNSYVFLPFEIEHATLKSISSQISIDFIGQQSLLCQNFKEIINEHEDIYELYSIKMRNLYSLCVNKESKFMIIQDIFSTQITHPKFITQETKNRLLNLDKELIEDINHILNSILDIIINENILNNIQGLISDEQCRIVLPNIVYDNKDYFELIEKELNKSSKYTLSTWNEIGSIKEKQILILDYRDSGVFPYRIYPNVYETYFSQDQFSMGIYFEMFFKYNYERTFFDYFQTLLYKIIPHPARHRLFNWDEVISKFNNKKPTYHALDHLWDLENSYGGYTERESFVVTFKSGLKKKYHPSQLFIAQTGQDGHLYTVKADELHGEYKENTGIYVQPLEEIYEELNLFEATAEEEVEIEQLKRHYDLKENDLEYRLWKILLKREAGDNGDSEVYNKLKNQIEEMGDKMVKKTYFKQHWLDPESESLIPRSKKVFKAVCDSLGLPSVYFRVMLKKRARERLASRKSTSKMNRLIVDLIHNGYFDDSPNSEIKESFGKFFEAHDLEEIGMTLEDIEGELTTLVELLKPSLNLMKIQKTELQKS